MRSVALQQRRAIATNGLTEQKNWLGGDLTDHRGSHAPHAPFQEPLKSWFRGPCRTGDTHTQEQPLNSRVKTTLPATADPTNGAVDDVHRGPGNLECTPGTETQHHIKCIEGRTG